MVDLKNERCPRCKAQMLMVFGNGFDYDYLFCSNLKCNFEKVLSTSSYPAIKNDNEVITYGNN